MPTRKMSILYFQWERYGISNHTIDIFMVNIPYIAEVYIVVTSIVKIYEYVAI